MELWLPSFGRSLELLSLLLTTSFSALAGDIRMIECATCSAPIDFQNAAISDSYYNPGNLTYIVVSESAPRTAYVHVSGYWMWDPFTYQNWWTPSGATMVNNDGGLLSTDPSTASAQLEVIDVNFFAAARDNSPKVFQISMPVEYADSFIGSDDALDSPGIGYALLAKGINPATLQVGTVILVTYADGSKAAFVRTPGLSTLLFIWNGLNAWDSQGRPVNRNGTLLLNPNSTGNASGSASISDISYANESTMWVVVGSPLCAASSTLHIGGVLAGTWSGYVPCN
jgi:hypothetical protein